MNTSRRWMNLMRFSLNVAVSLQTIRIRSERTPFSNGGHSTTRNRSKLAQKDRLNHSCGKRLTEDLDGQRLNVRQLRCRPTAPQTGLPEYLSHDVFDHAVQPDQSRSMDGPRSMLPKALKPWQKSLIFRSRAEGSLK